MKVDVQQIKQRFGIIGNNPGLNRLICSYYRREWSREGDFPANYSPEQSA